MSKIQNIESTPNYISNFLKANMELLCDIHDEGKKEYGNCYGCLGLKCSVNENTMDVFYMTEINIIRTLNQESWEQLKTTIGEKRLFLINDLDLNSIFLIYI